MPDFCRFLSKLSGIKKKRKIILKKCLTFSRYRVIVYGLSKLGRKRNVKSNLWNAEKSASL